MFQPYAASVNLRAAGSRVKVVLTLATSCHNVADGLRCVTALQCQLLVSWGKGGGGRGRVAAVGLGVGGRQGEGEGEGESGFKLPHPPEPPLSGGHDSTHHRMDLIHSMLLVGSIHGCY